MLPRVFPLKIQLVCRVVKMSEIGYDVNVLHRKTFWIISLVSSFKDLDIVLKVRHMLMRLILSNNF